jgi:hypothetical protein
MLYVVELSPSSSATAISPELAAQSLNSSTDGFANNVDARHVVVKGPILQRSRVLAEYQKVSLNLILPESATSRNTNGQIEDFRRFVALPAT